MALKPNSKPLTAWMLLGIAVLASSAVLLNRRASSHSFPLIAEVRLPNGDVINSEVSDTWRTIERGLMGRASLTPGGGMLFVYPNTGRHRHWMYRCLIPLDIIWIGSDKRIVEIVRGAEPCSTKPCPSYGHHAFTRYVLELAAGGAGSSGLRIGDQLEFLD